MGVGPHVVRLTFLSWGGGSFSVVTEAKGHLLAGLGPPLGNAPHALYVVSFTEMPSGPY